MKAEFSEDSSGGLGILCKPESDAERLLLRQFVLQHEKKDREFCIHNWGHQCFLPGVISFYFGFRKKTKNIEQKKTHRKNTGTKKINKERER